MKDLHLLSQRARKSHSKSVPHKSVDLLAVVFAVVEGAAAVTAVVAAAVAAVAAAAAAVDAIVTAAVDALDVVAVECEVEVRVRVSTGEGKKQRCGDRC